MRDLKRTLALLLPALRTSSLDYCRFFKLVNANSYYKVKKISSIQANTKNDLKNIQISSFSSRYHVIALLLM